MKILELLNGNSSYSSRKNWHAYDHYWGILPVDIIAKKQGALKFKIFLRSPTTDPFQFSIDRLIRFDVPRYREYFHL